MEFVAAVWANRYVCRNAVGRTRHVFGNRPRVNMLRVLPHEPFFRSAARTQTKPQVGLRRVLVARYGLLLEVFFGVHSRSTFR